MMVPTSFYVVRVLFYWIHFYSKSSKISKVVFKMLVLGNLFQGSLIIKKKKQKNNKFNWSQIVHPFNPIFDNSFEHFVW